jgi:TRAP-type C4-dicarboxylate transport system permease small subunit
MSSHGFEAQAPQAPALPSHRGAAVLAEVLNRINRLLLAISMFAMILTALVLSYSVVMRYFFKVATDWQDEAAVFMLVGATFFCAAYVQSFRGHIGIEALAGLLSPRVNRIRLILVDLLSFLFCAFFSWKSWAMFHEALVEGQTTSSTLAPPLWIPYSLMAFGMTLLSVQILVQLIGRLTQKDES